MCIQHDSDRKVVSCYMHLQTYRISDGDRVTAGETIGYVGRTGVKVSPPHLHLEIRVDDRCIEPGPLSGRSGDPAQGDDDPSLRDEARPPARVGDPTGRHV